MRKFVIATFENICLAGVYLVTIVCVAIAFLGLRNDGNVLFAIIVVVGGFVSASVVFGGALVLLDIAASLNRLVELAERERP